MEHLVLPRLVSIAEDYSRSRLVEVSEAVVRLEHPLEIRMWAQTEESAESSWDSIKRSWTEWHAVTISDAPTYGPLRGFVEARNTILHGLGELTRKQLRGRNANRTRTRFGQAGITTVGRRIRLSSADVENSAKAAIGFVQWLDHELVDRGFVDLAT
jgi:hypothetical protein